MTSPPEKIRETVEFVFGFDFETIARQTIDSMLAALEEGGIEAAQVT